MELTEHRLRDLSKIEVRYFTTPATKQYHEILIVKYIGTYPFGSGGNDDARYMSAMARAGIDAFDGLWAVIHDLSALKYEWGDMLEQVICIGPAVSDGPVAVVVGPQCEEAVRTLCLGERSTDPIEKIGNVFRSLAEACRYVDDRIK
jgi:hypothetical protein